MKTEKIPLCDRCDMLTDEQMDILVSNSELRQYKKGQYIYEEGNVDDYIYILKSGSVKIARSTNEGREVIKNVIHHDMIFGECVVTGCKERQNYAKALDNDVAVYALKLDALKAVMAENFDFCLFVMAEIRTKLTFAEKRMESLVVNDARSRIVDFIKYNAAKAGKAIGFETLVKHSLTQQDIANYTGTSRQTVTSVFNDLKKDNQIYFKRKSILIRDMKSLA